ncbi:Helicase SKI2W [Sarracenia purpurea var. burkii]
MENKRQDGLPDRSLPMDRVAAANELAFRVGFSGHSGHLRIEPLPPVERPNPLNSLPDFIPPPAFASETPESIKEYIEDKYLLPRLDPDEFSPEKAGRYWEFDWFNKAKIHLEPSLPRSVVVPAWELPFRRLKKGSEQGKWEPISVEMEISELTVEADDSGGLPRIAGPAKDFVKGSINNRPFRPGGLNDSQASDRVLPAGASNGQWVWEVINGGPPQTIPPGFKQGLDLGDLDNELSVQFDDLFMKAWEEDVAEFGRDGL